MFRKERGALPEVKVSSSWRKIILGWRKLTQNIGNYDIQISPIFHVFHTFFVESKPLKRVIRKLIVQNKASWSVDKMSAESLLAIIIWSNITKQIIQGKKFAH